MRMIPRRVKFLNGRCVSVGFAAPVNFDSEKTMSFPSDHCDFIGPVNPIGLTESEIEDKIQELTC